MREAVRGRLPVAGAWALLGVLLALAAVNLPELGSDPWPFRPPSVHPEGPLAPLVRAAGREWDTGIARAAAFLAALLVALAGAFTMRRRSWPAWWGSALVLLVSLALLLPSTLLQAGLRQSTAPWFYVNDSTYQVELAGDLLRHGHNPYGHDYRSSGMERFYTYDGTVSPRVRRREVALRHYAYLPGTVVTASVWGLLPKPLDDYRLFILLATVGCFFAVMAFRAPLSWRLAIGAIVVCNPIAVRSAWFGQNDAPSLLFLILSFALFTRRRYRWSAATLAAAVLMKQFAVVAVPFLAVMLLKRSLPRAELKRVAVVFVAVLAAGILPFLLWDPRAFIDDTVRYGAGTYRIVGYGLSAILVRLGVVADREGSYPFALLAVLLWLPLTAWLLYAQWHARELWLGAAAFAISILVLLFVGRTFNNYYLVWPLMGAAIAAAMAGGERAPARAPPPRGA
jgi:4-amino-4-deoxy-L-arabinose transferase-like glycosyltransferase